MASGSVLLRDPAAGHWLEFNTPHEIVRVHNLAGVMHALHKIEAWADAGGYAAGFISYEAAPAFDRALKAHSLADFPLLWFGLFDAPRLVTPVFDSPPPLELSWTPNVTRATYTAAIDAVRDHIARGDTYQVNYTLRLRAPFAGDPEQIFAQLVRAQPKSYAAYLDTGRYVIASASPELFFRREGAHLTMRPMKGTAPRGRFTREDRAQANWLYASEKNRAENVMITDMARNDLGRVAAIGGVRVARLWETERYPTVWQMTSTVQAQSDASTVDVLRATFPCASITGAPKPRTTQIIAALEPEPRGIYTGAIGYFAPRRQAQFSVAIRTAVLDRVQQRAEYGVGGGIVWDSNAADEWDEVEHKAQVLTVPVQPFSLIESFRWSPDEGYRLRDYHLRRMRDSADYFDIPFDAAGVQGELDCGAQTLPPFPHKARLLLAQDGTLTFSAAPLETQPEPVPLAVARAPVQSNDRFLFHKTTRRAVYDAALAERGDAADVILFNERSQVTETCAANLIFQFGNERVTPPLECGLLGGTFRAYLLDTKQVVERVVRLDELPRADAVWRVNSVRGWQRARLLRYGLNH